ncbi:hypothetical protein AB0K67_12400 [Nonomuraea sp. NPDC052634]|uniref:hypothetical protein n=1 Tax=Nonomuraea sp. NPDC052634 TaxID=3155813 RepID=UPI00341B3787
MFGPLSPPWIEAVPPWDPAADLLPAWDAPAGTATPGVPSTGPLASPVPPPYDKSLPLPGTARPPAPPHKDVERPQGSPAPQAPPRPPARPAHEPARPPVEPRAIAPVRPSSGPPAQVTRPAPRPGMPDPCATFHDFRRGPCYDVLNRLTR